MATEQDPSTTVRARYEHPQGGKITVFADGSMDVRDAGGRKKRTTATPEKLAAGHGQWKQVG